MAGKKQERLTMDVIIKDGFPRLGLKDSRIAELEAENTGLTSVNKELVEEN